ncbi:unnamed protein product [Vitrella brassicaformis CCMP3155]|uniref:Uncharacterized protein n=1 Tax=Vitrella brassicaformis (strain CCMP3155) TaxID=1169540 RepID=A0A0G4GLK7_VITBC|nr:unnamed protein product [Vitrella brassicaformis CCMP3155]|eukprot:CEM30998.1 unnamed protein product [Vitrella brassicaformis CCMP3155]
MLEDDARLMLEDDARKDKATIPKRGEQTALIPANWTLRDIDKFSPSDAKEELEELCELQVEIDEEEMSDSESDSESEDMDESTEDSGDE